MIPLGDAKRVFLDTAPLIYFVEGDERYIGLLRPLFERIDQGLLSAVTSPITLAECLVLPYRKGRLDLACRFLERIVGGANTTFVPLDQEIARRASELRASHNLALDDAFQLATCLASGCDAFLTNDKGMKRVTELPIAVLDE